MNPRVIDVIPNEDHTLTLTFSNNEIRIFDVIKYLEYGIFNELKKYNIFKTVKVFMGTIQWVHGQDFCPDTLYEESVPIDISASKKAR